MNSRNSIALTLFASMLGIGYVVWKSTNVPSRAADESLVQPFDGPASDANASSEKSASRSEFERRLNAWKSLASENDFPELSLKEVEMAWLRQVYRETPREELNWRGTLLYVYARNARRLSDTLFLAEALREPPCQGFRDCDRPDPGLDSTGIRTTLLYPQKVAEYQLSQKLASLTPGTEEYELVHRALAE